MMKLIAASAVFLAPLLAFAQEVPPDQCNTDFARIYMLEHVAKQLDVAPEKIASIATLGGAGGNGGHEGKPGDREYKSELSCPIRVTFASGGHEFMTYHERYSTLHGEEVAFTRFPSDPNNPTLQWIDTKVH